MVDTTKLHMVKGFKEKEDFSADDFAQEHEDPLREAEESCYGDLLLGQIAICERLLAPGDLDHLLLAQKKSGEKLGRLMVTRQLITEMELATLLEKQRDALRKRLDDEKRAIMLCKKCGTDFNVNVPDPNAFYRCPNCKGVLIRRTGPQHAIERDNSIKPEPDTEMPGEVRSAATRGNEMFGKYLILKNVGTGGGGIVYRAFDVELERIVALKIISYSTELDLERTRTGALLAARLEHGGIPRIYEAGIHEGTHFIAMQYIDGCSLEGRELPLDEALRVCMEAANILHFAHVNGIIHRDVKPSNIMVDTNGRVWLTDFGIAKPARGRTKGDTTGTGDIVGTPQFMSPEQASGNIRELDSRSDVFSLGATLYYLVTGSYPFSAQNLLGLVKKIISSDPAPVSSLRPDIPREVGAIINMAIEKEKERRYRSAKEFAADIERFMNGESVKAKPAGLCEKLTRKIRRNKRLVAVSSAITLLFLVVAGLGIAEWIARKRAEDLAAQLLVEFIENVNRRHNEALEGRKKGCPFEILDHIAASTRNDYRRLVALGIRDPRVDYSLGKIYRIIGDEILARDHFQIALSMDPDFAPANYELGVILYRSYFDRLQHLDDARKKNVPTEPHGSQIRDATSVSLRERALSHLSRAIHLPTAKALVAFLNGDSREALVLLSDETVDEDAVELLVRIKFNDKLYREAGEILNIAIEADRGNVHFLLIRARVHSGFGDRDFLSGIDPSGNYGRAIADWETAARLNSRLSEPLKNVGRSFNAIGVFKQNNGRDPLPDYEKALVFYEKAAGIEENSSEIAFLCGSAKGNLGFYNSLLGNDPTESYAAALLDFDKAIALDSGSSQAWQGRGHLFMNRADYNKGRGIPIEEDLKYAINDYTRAVELDASDFQTRGERAWVLNNIAMHEFRMGKNPLDSFQQSLADFDSAIRGKPDVAELFRKRGTVRVNMSLYKIKVGADVSTDYKEALADFEAAIALNPRDADTWLARAGLWNNWGLRKWRSGTDPTPEYSKALADYRKGIEINPSDFDAYLGRGDLHLNWGLSNTNESLKLFGSAVEDYNASLKLNSSCFRAYVGKGMAQAQIGRLRKSASVYRESLENFKNAVAINAADERVWIQKGETHGYLANLLATSGSDAAGEFEEALHCMDIAEQIAVSDDDIFALRAGIRVNYASLTKTDPFPDYNLAMEDIARALELNPASSIAWTNRGFLCYNRAIHHGRRDRFSEAADGFEAAAEAWEKAISLNPLLDSHYSERVRLAQRKGEEARKLSKEY